MKKETVTKILYYFVLASFIIPIAYLVWRIASGVEGSKSRADYALMLVQCALGALVIHLPSFLERKFKLEIPAFLYIMYIIFLYCAIFLGEVRSFYYIVPHWDDFLHCCSSMMTGMFGFMLVSILNRNRHVAIRLSPAFIALFAFSFSVTFGALWEIYEFAFDGIMGLNMQKFALESGEQLIGHEALRDTMSDIIVDCCGAFVASFIGFLSLKLKKGWTYSVISDEKAHGKEENN